MVNTANADPNSQPINTPQFSHEDSLNLYISGWLTRLFSNSTWRVYSEVAVPCQFTVTADYLKDVQLNEEGIGYIDHVLVKTQEDSYDKVVVISVKKGKFLLQELYQELLVARYPIGVCHRFGLTNFKKELEYWIVGEAFDARLSKWVKDYNTLLREVDVSQVTLPLVKTFEFHELGGKLTSLADNARVKLYKEPSSVNLPGPTFSQSQHRQESGLNPFKMVFPKFNFWSKT